MEIRKFKPGFEALGLVADFVADDLPFSDFKARKLLTALRYQLSQGCHAAGFVDDRIVAYCGWMLITETTGEHWLKGTGRLTPARPDAANAAALTIVRIPDRANVQPMIRACRSDNPGRRVFFKRQYDDGITATKKATVLNRTSS